MANPSPNLSTRFQKGHVANPRGRVPIPDALKKVVGLTSDEIKLTISKHFRMTEAEIQLVTQDEKATALERLIASTIARAIRDGDIARAEFLLIRCVGRVKETVEVIQPKPVVIEKIGGEQMILDTEIVQHGND